MDSEPPRTHRKHGHIVAVLITAAIGVALTWVFCNQYLWKAADPRRGAARLPWEPGSLYAVTILEFLTLGAFIIAVAVGARRTRALVWCVSALFVFNIVLTVALFGFAVI